MCAQASHGGHGELPGRLAQLAAAYVRDAVTARARGWKPWANSLHTEPQALYIARWAAPRLDLLVPLDGGTRAWERLAAAAALNASAGFALPHANTKSSWNFSRAAVLGSLDARAWRDVCTHLAADYACLGYDLPPQCRAHNPTRAIGVSS